MYFGRLVRGRVKFQAVFRDAGASVLYTVFVRQTQRRCTSASKLRGGIDLCKKRHTVMSFWSFESGGQAHICPRAKIILDFARYVC